MRAEGGEGTGLPDPGGFHPDHMTDALSPPTSTQMWRDTPYLLEEGSDGTHEDGTILKQKSSLCAPGLLKLFLFIEIKLKIKYVEMSPKLLTGIKLKLNLK